MSSKIIKKNSSNNLSYQNNFGVGKKFQVKNWQKEGTKHLWLPHSTGLRVLSFMLSRTSKVDGRKDVLYAIWSLGSFAICHLLTDGDGYLFCCLGTCPYTSAQMSPKNFSYLLTVCLSYNDSNIIQSWGPDFFVFLKIHVSAYLPLLRYVFFL